MKLIRHLLGLLRSHGGINQVALGATVGTMAGIIPGSGLYILLWSLLMVIFRLSLSAFFLFYAIFYLLSMYGMHSLAYTTGYAMLEDHGPRVTWFWQYFCSLPGICLLELRNYSVLGSWTLASLWAVFVYLSVRRVYRKISNSKFFQTCKQKMAQSHWTKLLLGDQPFQGNILIRGRLLCYLMIAIIFVFMSFSLFSTVFLKRIIERAGSTFLGVPFKVEEVAWQWWQGKFLLRSVTISDPKDAQEHLFFADLIEVDVSSAGLLRGQLVFEKICLKDCNVWIRRQEKGTFHFASLRPFQYRAQYLQKATEMIDHDKIKLDSGEKILRAQELDWLGEFYRWAIQQKAIDAYRDWYRLERITEYGERIAKSEQVLRYQVMTALLNVPRLETLEKLLQLSPREIILIAGRANYIDWSPSVVCRHLYGENLKLYLVSPQQGTENTLISFELDNLYAQQDQLKIAQSQPPITCKLTLQSMPLEKYSYFGKQSLPLLFKEGKFNFISSLCYTSKENNFFGICEASFQNVQAIANPDFKYLESQMPTTKYGQITLAGFIEWLNTSRSVTIPLEMHGFDLSLDKTWKERDKLNTQIYNKISTATKEEVKRQKGCILNKFSTALLPFMESKEQEPESKKENQQ